VHFNNDVKLRIPENLSGFQAQTDSRCKQAIHQVKQRSLPPGLIRNNTQDRSDDPPAAFANLLQHKLADVTGEQAVANAIPEDG